MILMVQGQLERTVNKRNIQISPVVRDSSLNRAVRLYEHSIGLSDLVPSLIRDYREKLARLNLPQKIVVYRDLRDNGRNHIKGGGFFEGSIYLGASHYFWQNFIVLEGNPN